PDGVIHLGRLARSRSENVMLRCVRRLVAAAAVARYHGECSVSYGPLAGTRFEVIAENNSASFRCVRGIFERQRRLPRRDGDAKTADGVRVGIAGVVMLEPAG